MSTPLHPDRADDNGLTDLEQALGALRPVSHIQRDQILFLAGQRSAAPPQPGRFCTKLWPALAASLAVVVLGQGVLLARRPLKEIEVVYVQVPQPPAPAPVTPQATALAQIPTAAIRPQRWLDAPGPTATNRLSWQLIRYGLDALPATPVAALAPSEAPLTAGQNFQNDVRRLMNPGDPP